MMIPDIPYLGRGRPQTLDLHQPREPVRTPGPAVLIIHGGGWKTGDKRSRRELQMAEVLTAAGYVCASINYTMITDGGPAWPGYLDDARAALRFLRQRADEYGIDPGRVGAIGGSAGGNIALMLGVGGPGDAAAPPPVRAVVALYPPTHMAWRGRERVELFGATGEELGRRARAASPLLLATRGFPPTFLIHGTADTTVDVEQSHQMAGRLQELGVPHRVRIVDGGPHSFKLHDEHADVRAEVVAFFDEHLRG